MGRLNTIGLDTECTGLDVHHGARPFLVSITDEDGYSTWWEWEVDTKTRKVHAPDLDLQEVQEAINGAKHIILQNAKFDYLMLVGLFEDHMMHLEWDWSKIYDTLIAGHLLASNKPHTLAAMAVQYLNYSISSLEEDLGKAVAKCRTLAKAKCPKWRLAEAGMPDMPSLKGKVWKNDCWLPRQLARKLKYPAGHPFHTVCSTYANGDTAVLLPLHQQQLRSIRERKLERIYHERLKVLRVPCIMEQRGVSISIPRVRFLRGRYSRQAKRDARACLSIAEQHNYSLTLPKGGSNNSLRTFVFNHLRLPVVARSDKTQEPSIKREALDTYEAQLSTGKLPTVTPHALTFVRALRSKRRHDTALAYLQSYQRFWLPGPTSYGANWRVLHPTLNPTGADTLRWSSQNPNEQNISKQEDVGLRYCFGPAPGREWWSLDAKNIELRIPAYEAGEREMIDLFENPDEAPYYGSYHLLIFDILHPKKFAKHGAACKQKYAATWYQWTKNGNFAVQYGAQEASGTADRAYHVDGAQRRIQGRFTQVTRLGREMVTLAQRQGYVETLPDRSVDPDRGYPLLCTRTRSNYILPTIPLNYHVQGTAMWWMMKAMLRCQDYLDQINCRQSNPEHHYHMIMQVHDELVFDFPARRKGTQLLNRPRIRKIQQLMEQGGKDIGIPTPVSVTYHPHNWNEGETDAA